jgi:UDP-glucose 4-epimerase
MKILVTGGAGFIGSNLVQKLEGQITVWDNLSTGKLSNIKKDVEFVKLDLREPLPENINKEFDIIYHLAAQARIQPSFIDPFSYFQSNVVGTNRILEIAKENKAKVIYAGTSSIYHEPFANPYTFTKWQGEQACEVYNKLFDVPVAICRFFNVYGPNHIREGEFVTVIGTFERQKLAGEPLTITGTGEKRRDFCVTGDTLVLLSDFKWVKIKDIQIGDEVISFGNPINKKRYFQLSKVTAVCDYISDDVYEIITEDGRVCATGNHPWLMDRRGYCDTNSLIKSLNNNVYKSLKKFSIPIITSITKEYKHGYLVGSLLGDGFVYENLNASNKHSSGLEVTDLDFHERFLLWSKEFEIDLNVRSKQPKYPGSKLVYVAQSGKKSTYLKYKKIIESSDFDNEDFCKGYMAALFDGEGEYDTFNNKGLRISNKDILICENIRQILLKNNFRWHERLRDDGLIYFTLQGGLNEEVRFFSTFLPAIQRKRPDMNRRQVKGKMDRIKSIKKINPERVYSIEVENTHTYIANGFLCHNTHVYDIVSGLIAASQKNWNAQIFNLGRGNNHSINEVAAMFKSEMKYIPNRPGEAQTTLADLKETIRLLDWIPTHNLEDYVQDFLSNEVLN